MGNIRVLDFKDKIINMHTHTARCQHAKGEDREYVEKAIEAGFEVMGFSDHAPYLFEGDYVSPIRMGMEELEDYVDSILSLKQEYKKDIEIYCGFEMEYFPKLFDRTMEKLDQYPIDYLILGQHFFDDEEGWITPKIAWPDEEHLRMYVERIMTGIQTDRFLYVAHPDIICFTGEKEIYRKHIMPLIQEMKRRNMPIEINMNGLQAGMNYPTVEFIELGIENGNDFIVGVDAHAPEKFLDFDDYKKCMQLVLERGGKIINNLKI